MKKNKSLLIFVLIITIFTACGKKEVPESTEVEIDTSMIVNDVEI